MYIMALGFNNIIIIINNIIITPPPSRRQAPVEGAPRGAQGGGPKRGPPIYIYYDIHIYIYI